MSRDISSEEFLKNLQSHSVVPMYRKIIFDTATPISLAWHFRNDESACLLEGILGSARYDRYSYLALNPYLTVTVQDDHIETVTSDGKKERVAENLFAFLQRMSDEFCAPKHEGEKFFSGIIGYLSYECVKFEEKITFPKNRSLGMPLAKFILPRDMIVIDNLDRSLLLVHNIFKKEHAAKSDLEIFEAAQKGLKVLSERIFKLTSHTIPLVSMETPAVPKDFAWNIAKSDFQKSVKICKDYITAGDIFQIQISRRAKVAAPGEPFDIYRKLRYLNPSPFMFYLKLKEFCLLGASPELLVQVEKEDMTLCPIAGTRKRRSKERSEEEIIEELRNDEKEKAEHIMLVDLARNDVGRVCEYGSVKVTQLMGVEKYSHVIHMVSNVVGKLKKGKGAIDALRSSFPAGTVTGTPKIRAMEIISELESEQREFYAGGLMFLDFQGNLKAALTIRSILVKDGFAYTQAAAGIVSDSIDEMEYKETENKLRASLEVLSTSDVSGENAR